MSRIRFRTSDDVELEGEVREPDGAPRGGAVLCHAHPAHGGSKDHPVLWAIRNELGGRRGLWTLAFNFRGVMGSSGEHAGGATELLDVEAAVSHVRANAEGPLVLAGWSFGAAMALRYAVEHSDLAALALIGLALVETPLRIPSLPSRDDLRRIDAPVLLVSGAADQFSPAPEMRSFARKLSRAEVVVVPDTDHFFWRRERDLAAAVGDFVERELEP